MDNSNTLRVRLSFIFDVLVFVALFFGAGWGWFGSLFMAEILGWLVRLYWISRPMLNFIVRRLLHMIPIILTVIGLGFLLIQLAPGDVFSQMELNPDIRPEVLERYRANYGVGQPWYVQFLKYVFNAIFRGDFGYSVNFKAPVFILVQQRAANTIILALTAFSFAWVASIPFGITAATKQYSWQDTTVSVFAFIGLSIPNYFLAFLLIYLIGNTGNWLPIGGMFSLNVDDMNVFQKALDLLSHLAVPAFVIGTAVMAGLTRIMRANMLEIMGMQYITTARAKGLTERTVIYKHALRNAINPMITVFGFQLGSILGGSALVENVTAWPGLGRLILQAILSQDLYLVIGSLIYSVALLIVGNLIADILLAVVDPRVRIS
jgi:peptide/nickel transport system permease protein